MVGSTHPTKAEETPPSISYFTLYRFSSKSDKLKIAVSLVSSVIAGLTLPLAIIEVAYVFQTMITHEKLVQANLQNNDLFLSKMHNFAITYSCIGATLFICTYLGNTLINISALNQIFRLRENYLKAVLNQDFEYFDLHQTTDFASKMGDDILKLEEGIGEKVSSFVYSVTTAIGCLTMALLKGWKLALLCLVTTPITFALVGVTGRIADNMYKQEAKLKSRASAIAAEVISSIRTVYAFNGQKREVERYRKPLAEAKKVFIKKEFYTGLSMGFLFFCMFCSYALSFYFGIFLVLNDPQNYNADVMFSVFFGVMTALGNLGWVGSLVRIFGLARGAGAQIFHLMDNVPTINPLIDRGFKLKQAEGVIELRDVVFQYPSRPDVSVLKGVSLSVKKGNSVALVGHSGCGKSTIIQLISRYYDVVSGSVRVDGIDVRELSVVWLRSQIGLVGQEPVLFNTTVGENIRYGRLDATDADIEAAAIEANAHNFIMNLPMGYKTLVGEHGESLSGGQKQRIAIARALIRRPRILLLDEATSALDYASEAKVQLALEKAAKSCTTVMVAHRLSTIRNADVIYVMQSGELVESGTHEELMTKHGHYFRMVVMQDPEQIFEAEPVRRASKLSLWESTEATSTTSVSSDDKRRETPSPSFWSMMALKSDEWKCMLVGIICSIAIGFASPLFIVVFGDLFGAMSSSDPTKLMEKVTRVSITCVLIGLIMGMTHLIEGIAYGVSGGQLTDRLRSRMFAHILKQQVSFFDEKANSTGALCAKLSSEVSYVQAATGHRIGVCVQGIGSVGLALVLAMLFEWRVGVLALTFLPLIVIVIYYQSKATSKESFGNARALENSTKIAMEAVCNVRTVASLGLEPWIVSEYKRALLPALHPALVNTHCRGLVAGLARSMFNFINAAALTYGGHLIVSEGIRYEDILITTQSLQMASGQAQHAFTFTPEFQKGVSAASRIISLLRTKPQIRSTDTSIISPFESQGTASFKNVEFRYPTRPGIQVLRGINIDIENSKTIALVGRSGCGKSTIIQLLERFYDPNKGEVRLDGTPLRLISTAEARRPFGLVSQEPVLFDYSIEENIAYGDHERSPSHQDVVEAAQQANIHSFVTSLPLGYQTNIGPKGLQLSGGQKQRVAIARALIRRPKILLLDEATSALDTESEKVVQAALDAATATRTCVVIAHRLSTIRDADVLCVLSQGRIAEMGTHKELMELKGLYYTLHSTS